MKITKDRLLDIIAEASHRLHLELRRTYETGGLQEYLCGIGMSDLYPIDEITLYETNPDGLILVFGDSSIKGCEIMGVMKDLGISKDRIELHLSYEEIKSFQFKKIQYNPKYRLILFGPVPHSGEGKQEKSSIISQLESDDGYPKIIRLTDGHGLKITKTNLRATLEEEIRSGYLEIRGY
ncbi:MAG TPA: hypothetical protein PK581_06845 [Caldisericia bacterium]|nr:hypothetical protein [Caldisericia bacterium]